MAKNTQQNLEKNIEKNLGLQAEVQRSGRSRRAIVAGNASFWYTKLQQKLVSQALISNFERVSELDMFYTKEDWINGLKEYVYQSFYSIKDYSKDVSISDFNPKDNLVDSVIKNITDKKYLSFVIPNQELIQAFLKPATLSAFTLARIESAFNTWNNFLFNQKVKFLFDATNNVLDATETVDFSTDTKIRECLTKIRTKIASFQTPSKTHIKLNDDISEATDKLVYRATSSSLVFVVNAKYNAQIENLTASLYNKQDILIKTEKQVWDFDSVEGLTANDKKTVAFLIDKRALRIGFQIDEKSQIIKLPKFKILHEQTKWFGLARLRNFPIVLYKTA